VARVVYKDESTRLGLGAFKALGGAYAVADLVREQVAKGANVGEVTVATATDGNHGRSVAWGAQLAGCNAKIYIHEHVSRAREAAMQAYGAEVIRVQGNYEVSLADCRADAEANGWHLVSDTSWEGYVDVPRAIMAGYTVMGREIIDQLGEDALTHAFLPIGVGGLAAGVAAPLWAHMGAQLCNLISIESTMSCCFADSIEAGRPTLFDITEETLMAGLSCGEVSLVAWEILQPALSHSMAISDEAVAPLMRWFHERSPSIEAGECSTSGLAGLLQAHKNPQHWQSMGFDANSVVLLIGTEGATDPDLYAKIISGN
jgi:diaminopropionate ammonia-lyase